jgi:hypothetical protein
MPKRATAVVPWSDTNLTVALLNSAVLARSGGGRLM